MPVFQYRVGIEVDPIPQGDDGSLVGLPEPGRMDMAGDDGIVAFGKALGRVPAQHGFRIPGGPAAGSLTAAVAAGPEGESPERMS